MNRSTRFALCKKTHSARGTAFAKSALCLCALVLCAASFAQAGELGLRPSQTANASPADNAATPPESETIDWNELNWDPSKLSVSGPSASGPSAWSTAATAKKTLPTGWDTKAGIDSKSADQNTVGAPIDPDRLLPGAAAHTSSGAAWASVTAPALDAPGGWDKATIDARFDSLNEERKLGTTISKSVPLNDRFSVTLQNGYSMTQSQTPGSTVTIPGTLGASAPYGTSHSFSSDNMAKLNLLPTGTSLSVGTAMSTTDEKWLRSIGAEQKLFDGISVKGSVSETATGVPDRSISAGFKRNW